MKRLISTCGAILVAACGNLGETTSVRPNPPSDGAPSDAGPDAGENAARDSGVRDDPRPPIYIFPFVHTEDHVNVGDGPDPGPSEERFLRVVPFLEGLKAAHPELALAGGPIATIEFYGADSEAFEGREAATGVVSVLRKAETTDVIEIGYHGAHEPTEATNPIRRCTKPVVDEASALAYLDIVELFLTVRSHPWQGFPACDALDTLDRAMAGGLKKTMLTFFGVERTARMTTITGILGGGSSLTVSALRERAPSFATFGFDDHGPCPPNQPNPSGVCATSDADAAIMRDLGARLSPTKRSAPELFWAGNVLRSSTDGGGKGGIGMLAAVEGPAALATELATLDRSRPHVVQLFFAHHNLYSKKAPAKWAYEHQGARLPESELRPRDEIESRYRATMSSFEFLANEFLPRESPRGALVTGRGLLGMVLPESGFAVDAAALDAANGNMLSGWTDSPPLFADAGGERYYSLAEMLHLLAVALDTFERTGSFPESTMLREIRSPYLAGAPSPLPPAKTEVTADALFGAARQLAMDMGPGGGSAWTVPVRVALPGGVEADGLAVLRAFGELYGAIRTGAVPPPRIRLAPFGFRSDWKRVAPASLWTLKPAVLRDEVWR